MGQTVNLLVYTFGGSNPSSPTKSFHNIAEVAQSIEHQPSKLRVAGLSPVFRSTRKPRNNFEAFCFIHILKESSLSQLLIEGYA